MIALPMSVFARKFGTVNTAELMESLPEMKTVQEQMTAASNKYQDEFSKLQEEFNKKYQEFNALDASTPETIKERRVQEMQELDAKIRSSARQLTGISAASSSSSWPPSGKTS